MNAAYELGQPEWADSDSNVALAGLTGPEFGLSADEAVKHAAAKQQADRWASIHRAALVAAAEAIKARDWSAKREALALAEQAWGCADVMIRAVFGTAREVPARYADLVELGRCITSAQVVEAKAVIRADDGREFVRLDVSAMMLTDLGRMLRVSPNRRVEVARLGECWRSYLVRKVR